MGKRVIKHYYYPIDCQIKCLGCGNDYLERDNKVDDDGSWAELYCPVCKNVIQVYLSLGNISEYEIT